MKVYIIFSIAIDIILQFERNMPDTEVLKSTEKMENEEMEQCTLCDKVSSSCFIINLDQLNYNINVIIQCYN